MTNGEKLCIDFPNMRYTIFEHRVITTIGIAASFDLDWWNAEYKESTTKNDLAHNLCDSCTNIGCEFQSGIVRTECAFYMPPHMEPDNCGNYIVQESTTKNNLEVDCNNCKNNFHRGDGTSYCATGDGMCHYECEEPTTKNDLAVTNERIRKTVTTRQLEKLYEDYEKSLWREHEDVRGDDMVELGTALNLLQEELCLLGCWDEEVEE